LPAIVDERPRHDYTRRNDLDGQSWISAMARKNNAAMIIDPDLYCFLRFLA
jgi:hypothetical protein